MKRIKIMLDRTSRPGRGSIVDAETGETIENVRAITIHAEVGKPTSVTLELIGIEVEGLVMAPADRFVFHRLTPQ